MPITIQAAQRCPKRPIIDLLPQTIANVSQKPTRQEIIPSMLTAGPCHLLPSPTLFCHHIIRPLRGAYANFRKGTGLRHTA